MYPKDWYTLMQQITLRGVVVYVKSHGESNRRIGVYTEEGMKYVTLYGAKSARKHLQSACALFTMGRFTFTSYKHSYKIIDIEVYDYGRTLVNTLEIYYAACAGVEIVRKMIDAEHSRQFKCLVDYLLFLISTPDVLWKHALIIFLWRSLHYNGWQPELPQSGTHVYYRSGQGFVSISHSTIDNSVNCILYTTLRILYEGDVKKYTHAVEDLSAIHSQELSVLMKILFQIWHEILGYTLSLEKFVIH